MRERVAKLYEALIDEAFGSNTAGPMAVRRNFGSRLSAK
jgi:hypothetical protein